jgi:hypothetical protein
MFNIGDFARFGGVSVRTLWYCEELDLLRLAEVDTHTGYRIYETHHLPRLHRMVALKDPGSHSNSSARCSTASARKLYRRTVRAIRRSGVTREAGLPSLGNESAPLCAGAAT